MSSTDDTVAPATDEEEVEVVEVDEVREGLLDAMRAELGDALVGTHVRPGDDVWIRVTNEAWTEAGLVARDKLQCRHFTFLSAIDWLPSPYGRYMDAEVDKVVAASEDGEGAAPAVEVPAIEQGYGGGDTRFQVFARVANITNDPRYFGITLKADVADEDPRIATWTKVFAGADWHERETWEMYGITFEGHPYLRHIYLPTGFEGYPLRKDFPLLARVVKPWPGIVDVEPMPGEGDAGEDETGEAEGAETGGGDA